MAKMARTKKAAQKLVGGQGTSPAQFMRDSAREGLGARYSSPGAKITAKRPLGQNTIDQSGIPKPRAIRPVHYKLTKDPTKTGEAWGLKPQQFASDTLRPTEEYMGKNPPRPEADGIVTRRW